LQYNLRYALLIEIGAKILKLLKRTQTKEKTMPFVNSCFFTKKEVERDNEFLASQGLTPAQQKAISIYLYERLSTNAIKNCIFTLVVVASPFLIPKLFH
jgi:hypothetical protein